MCLNLKNEMVEARIAKKDFVVYKSLYKYTRPKLGNHGKDFTGVIGGMKVSGRISEYEGWVYLCTNDERFNGNFVKDRLGFQYSWLFDLHCRAASCRGELLIDGITPFEIITGYKTSFRGFQINLGETYTAELEKKKSRIHRGIHSFKCPKEAAKYGDTVVECIIPKGSEYYIGLFSGKASYASNCLRYGDKVFEIGL